MIKEVHVFDCDGVLVDSSARYKTVIGADNIERIDLQYWRDNEYRAYDDKVTDFAKSVYQPMLYDVDNNTGIYPIIATARTLGEADERFIMDKLGCPPHIIYRKNHDNRGGAVIKINGLRKLLSLKPFKGVTKIFVYEDNIKYLHDICVAFKGKFEVKGTFIPSNQGH